jgi:hypothetical protein
VIDKLTVECRTFTVERGEVDSILIEVPHPTDVRDDHWIKLDACRDLVVAGGRAVREYWERHPLQPGETRIVPTWVSALDAAVRAAQASS